MKTKELIELLKLKDPSGEQQVVIPLAHGLPGSTAAITNVSIGLDWTQNRLCLNVHPPVTDASQVDYLRDEKRNIKNIAFLDLGSYSKGSGFYVFLQPAKKLRCGHKYEVRRLGCVTDLSFMVLLVSKEPELRVLHEYPQFVAELAK